MKDHLLDDCHSEKVKSYILHEQPLSLLVPPGSTSGRSSARRQAMALVQPQERRRPQDMKSAHGCFLSVVPAF